MKRLYRNKIGLTLIEILLSVFLMSVVFLAVSALFVASQTFFFTANNKVIISYEMQYAIEHIYKNVMKAIGDETSPPGSRPIKVPNAETLYITINNNDPHSYSYSKSGDAIKFSTDGINWESLVPKITVTGVSFDYNPPSDNLLTISLTGYYRDPAKPLTFYSACYPRLASF